jgi:hypothetical protein
MELSGWDILYEWSGKNFIRNFDFIIRRNRLLEKRLKSAVKNEWDLRRMNCECVIWAKRLVVRERGVKISGSEKPGKLLPI